MTIAKVILESDDPSPVLIDALTVRVFDTLGAFVTSDVTDILGEANFDIPDADYDLYFFKSGVSINAGMPLRITIDVADVDVPPNTFKVVAHVASLPEATDPLQCRISGFIRGADGNPTQDGKLTFSPTKETGVLGGNIIAPRHLTRISPDITGYYEFDLLRTLTYRAHFHFLDELLTARPPELEACVPDLPSLAIADLLFPVPVDADFEPEILALNVGDPEDDSVVLTTTYSDGSQRLVAPGFVVLSTVSDDEDVATVEMGPSGKVIVQAVAVGTANITIERVVSSTIYYDPVPTFVTETLVVTVT